MYSNIIALNKSTYVQLIQNAHQPMLKWTVFYSTILEDSAMSTIWISQF